MAKNKTVPTAPPTFDQISQTIGGGANALWHELNDLLQQEWKAQPKLDYSVCAGKPGWNIKYKKAGKSLCTLYPEPDSFAALVVMPLDLIPFVRADEANYTPATVELVRGGKPYLGTIWLMIPVRDRPALDDVIRLLRLKTGMQPY